MSKVDIFFKEFLKQESLFLDKNVLLSGYIPNQIMYRETQLQEAANILAPALRMERPSNLFIYGKTGTGKTLSIKHIINSMVSVAKEKALPLRTIYVNCKLKRVADTEYRLIARLIKELGQQIPSTGLPTDEVYNIFYSLIDREKQIILLVLDEIDQLTKKIGDGILYNLTRINAELKKAQICLIGVSNSLIFSDNLDPRVKSSLSEEEIIFPSYNALQIQALLRERACKAFAPNVIQAGVIEKCAAYAAKEHGDARRAIDLLRVAGEIAERSNSKMIEVTHLDDAEQRIESDKIINAIIDQPQQFQAVLYAILVLSPEKRHFFTGEIYEMYKNLCRKRKSDILTQRRVSDILGELDMLGVINAKIISKGRYGRTREISLSVEENIILKLTEMLEESLHMK